MKKDWTWVATLLLMWALGLGVGAFLWSRPPDIRGQKAEALENTKPSPEPDPYMSPVLRIAIDGDFPNVEKAFANAPLLEFRLPDTLIGPGRPVQPQRDGSVDLRLRINERWYTLTAQPDRGMYW